MWLVSEGAGILSGNKLAPRSVFLATVNQYNSFNPTSSNICVYCILPCLNAATGNLVWLCRPFGHFQTTLEGIQIVIFCCTLWTQGALEGCLSTPLRAYPEVIVPWACAVP